MNEVKPSKRPLIYYSLIVLAVILLFNLFIMPLISSAQIKEVDYGTFITMTENKEIGKVELQTNQILILNGL